MNPVIESLFSRKSVRAYSSRPISEQDKDLILESAFQAPTAGNQMLYTILEIDDEGLKKELSIACDNQPFIAKAKLVLVFLADCRRWLDCYERAGARCRKPGPGDLLLACEDAVIAAQNSVVAAQSLGIGSCYIGDILESREKVVDLLGLDEYVLPIAMVVYGYPDERQARIEKPKRFDREYIVLKNKYRSISEAESREMLARQRGKEPGFGFDAWIKAFCERKYMSGFALELDRSVRGYLEAFMAREPDAE
jgi:nitroreductase